MSDGLFDTLSRQLAAARSRREALAVFGSALGALFLSACASGPAAPTTPAPLSGPPPDPAPEDPDHQQTGEEVATAAGSGQSGGLWQAAVAPALAAGIAMLTGAAPAACGGSAPKRCGRYCCARTSTCCGSTGCCKSGTKCCSTGCCARGYSCCSRNRTCCSSSYPHYCSRTRRCYRFFTDAQRVCGRSYEVCHG